MSKSHCFLYKFFSLLVQNSFVTNIQNTYATLSLDMEEKMSLGNVVKLFLLIVLEMEGQLKNHIHLSGRY